MAPSPCLQLALRSGKQTVRALALLLVFATLPARADVKKVLMVAPRAMQRTALNMVTFRNRELALMQWVDVSAAFADAETTRRSMSRNGTERNPLLGQHPSGPRIYFSLLTMGFGYATMTQVVNDRVERPRNFELGITGLAVLAHGYVAYHNTTVCPGNLTCNPPPAN